MSEIKAIDTMNRLYYCKPELFKEAYDFAEIDEETEVLFYLGYTSYEMGEVGNAMRYFDGIIDVDETAEYFPNLVVLRGQLFYETFSYDDAVDWLERFHNADTLTAEYRQLAYLIEGLSLQAIERIDDAVDLLDKARNLDPATPAGETAAALLKELTG